jgi:hypothetical protein
METNSTLTAAVGAYLILAGALMVLFHRHVREIVDLHPPFLQVINPFRPRGKALTIVIIVFGALSFVGGLTVLLVNFVEP